MTPAMWLIVGMCIAFIGMLVWNIYEDWTDDVWNDLDDEEPFKGPWQ